MAAGRSGSAPEDLDQVWPRRSRLAVARNSPAAAGTRRTERLEHLIALVIAVGEEETAERAGRTAAASWSPWCESRDLRDGMDCFTRST